MSCELFSMLLLGFFTHTAPGNRTISRTQIVIIQHAFVSHPYLYLAHGISPRCQGGLLDQLKVRCPISGFPPLPRLIPLLPQSGFEHCDNLSVAVRVAIGLGFCK
jgi:hypothetical protein